MSDSKPEEKAPNVITDDLRIIVEGSEKKLFIKDKDGKSHRCYPLVMAEFLEFEREIGTSLFEIWNAKLKLSQIFFLLWLSLRKEGCSVDDLKRRNFKLTQADIQQMFDGAFLTKSVETFVAILSISGFGRDGKPANPQSPSQQPASEVGKGTILANGETK